MIRSSIASNSMSTIGLIILVLVILWTTTTGFQTSFMLKRDSSSSMEHTQLVARDEARQLSKILGLPIYGPKGSGFYFTTVKIGNPPKEFHLAVDTGSYLTWVSCIPCDGCPNTSSLVPLTFYDPHGSSSAEHLSCSGHLCKTLTDGHPQCTASHCGYTTSYADGTISTGSLYLDTFHLDTFAGVLPFRSTPANVVFGCTTHQSGDFSSPGSALDGILGLGPHPMSIVSQLESQGVMPLVFSHCLNAEGKGGGGTLVLGEIVEPGLVYTPLVPNQAHYNVELLSISINGQTLPIDPEVFSASRSHLGTAIDSGSTLSYLAEGAYDPFISALSAAVPPSVVSYTARGSQCFDSSNRDVFPLISLNFAGGARMILKPEAYLLRMVDDVGLGYFCVGFRKSQFQGFHGVTILGEFVLRDKIIVYDLAQKRLGWVDYDCGGTSSLNVSFFPPKVSHSSRLVLHHQWISIALAFLFIPTTNYYSLIGWVGLLNIFQGMTDSLKDAIEVSYLPKTNFEEGTQGAPLVDQLLELCDYLLVENDTRLTAAEAGYLIGRENRFSLFMWSMLTRGFFFPAP